METLMWIVLFTAIIALGMAYPRWRLRRALAQPFPAAWEATLRTNLRVYSHMPAELQAQLRVRVARFLHQKKFIGCAELEITDEIRVTIAAYAGLLLLNRPSKVYPDLHAVLVYPSAFMVPRKQVDEAGVVTEARQDLLGESWGDGRVVLSWDHVQSAGADWNDGQNVVLHEFAHQLDSESGSNNGAPFLGSQSNYRSWAAVLSYHFDSLQADAMFQQQSVLDHYGATSPAEFFAVATETFFEKPYQMAERHGDLYAEFQKYYRVDPREWLRAPTVESDYSSAHGQWQ